MPGEIECTCPECESTLDPIWRVWLRLRLNAILGRSGWFCPRCEEYDCTRHVAWHTRPERELFLRDLFHAYSFYN